MLKPRPEEELLRAQLDRARAALAHMQEVGRFGTWERDETTGDTVWSDSLLELLGVEARPGPEPGAWLDLVDSADRARVIEAIRAGLERGPSYSYECRIRVAGEERLIRVHTRVTRDQAGAAVRVDGIVQDMTDWQRSAAALAQSEAMQSAVIDAALDCVIVMNRHGLVVEWNKAAENTFGWSRAEALGQELAMLIIPPAYRDAHRRALTTLPSRKSRVLGRRLELTALRRDGTEFPVELTVGPVPGERPLFAGYLRDITERRQAEDARRAAESRWRALVEQIPAVTYLGHFDEAASMIYMSPQIERMTGFPPEPWLGESGFWLSRVHPEDVEHATAETEARYREGRGFSCTYRLRRADDTFIWIEERSTALPDEEGRPRYLQGVMMDVTERRRHEEELRAAQRLESVGQLAGGVAHDFNNLLGIIQGYAELLELQVPEEVSADVGEIRKAAERAADLTRQLLLFGRPETGAAEVVDLNDVVAGLENMLQRTLGEHVELTVEGGSPPCPVLIAVGQLEQVLVNLVVNARDAMPGGGRLVLTAGCTAERVWLRVSDTGTGMTDDVKARAFDPFFTTKETGRGSGLGLSTVYGIVQSAGGQIRLDTLSGRGTTVEIELPRAKEQARAPGAEAPEPAPSGQGETVMVVEDEGAVRELTGRILSENGYRVIDAADGYRARMLCDHHQGQIDLLLSDVVMPGMSGRQVAEQLRLLRPGLKVLYMSGHAGDVLDHHGLAGEEAPLLEKPFDRDRLLASVRAALS